MDEFIYRKLFSDFYSSISCGLFIDIVEHPKQKLV